MNEWPVASPTGDTESTSLMSASPTLQGIPEELVALITDELDAAGLIALSIASDRCYKLGTSVISAMNRSRILIDFREMDDPASQDLVPTEGYSINNPHFLTLILGSKIPPRIHHRQSRLYMTFVDFDAASHSQDTYTLLSRTEVPLRQVSDFNTTYLVFSRPIAQRHDPRLRDPFGLKVDVLIQIIPSAFTANPTELGCPELSHGHPPTLGYIFPSRKSLSAHLQPLASVLIDKPSWVDVELAVMRSDEELETQSREIEDQAYACALKASMISQGQSEDIAGARLKHVSDIFIVGAGDWTAFGHALREQERAEEFKHSCSVPLEPSHATSGT